MAVVLVVDDDRTVLQLVEKALSGDASIELVKATDAADGLSLLERYRPDLVLLDIMLPSANGLDIARQVQRFDARLPTVFITAKDDSDSAIEAMKLGAYDYLVKPLDIEQVRNLAQRALDTRRLMQSPVDWQKTEELPAEREALVGRSPAMLSVYKQIGRVAGQDVTVLIRGDSGTGKELVARAIYQHSVRKDRPFLAVNCAALAETLLESELFGHEKGSFTGADRRRIGKFEQCNGGTILLDEVGDMSPLVQGKVLRLLQEQRFERVGGTETIQTDVRIIAATNRDLERMIRENKFRLDLFHRLNSFEILLPPLRERGRDLELLVEHFLVRLNEQLGKNVSGISQEALELLTSFDWPGNVRELQSVLRKAILMATGPVLVPDFLPADIRNGRAHRLDHLPADDGDGDALPPHDLKRFVDQCEREGSMNLYSAAVQMMERYVLTRILRETAGNQSQAAERLGITRGSLRHKIRALGISIEHVVSSDS
jgi:DNA-binding NtrC family response regulator